MEITKLDKIDFKGKSFVFDSSLSYFHCGSKWITRDEYLKLTQEQVDSIVKAMSMAVQENHMMLAKMAVEETGRGIYEDKITKNIFASEYVYHSIKYDKTVGVIDKNKLLNVLGMLSFFKGMFFIYNGVECKTSHRLDLFEIDEINWDDLDLDVVSLLKKLTEFKKNNIFIDGIFNVDFINENAATLRLKNKDEEYYGIFNFDYENKVKVNLEDNEYLDILSNKMIKVRDSYIESNLEPIILKLA